MNLEQKLIAGKGDALYSEVLLNGLNISVREVLRKLSQGKTIEEVLKENPGMTAYDMQTCFEYSFRLIGAIDFKKAMSAINKVNKKGDAFINKIDSMLEKPDQFLY